MSDLSPLPDPPCGAATPDGEICQSDSTVVVASEWPTGYALAVWRCDDHIAASVEAARRLSPDAVITVTPLATIDHDDPTPDPATRDQAPLRLIR